MIENYIKQRGLYNKYNQQKNQSPIDSLIKAREHQRELIQQEKEKKEFEKFLKKDLEKIAEKQISKEFEKVFKGLSK